MDSITLAHHPRTHTLSPRRFHNSNDHVIRPKTADVLSSSSFPVSRRASPRPEQEIQKRSVPRTHRPETRAWVVEQEYIKVDKPASKTEQWVSEQVFLADRSNHRRSTSEGTEQFRCRMWDELMYQYEADAHRWMRQEEELRRKAEEKEKERNRVIQEDIRRIQARVRQRRDSERQTIAEERTREAERAKERVRRERARADRAMTEAWTTYESGWATLLASSGPLTFQDIPWPLLSPHANTEDIEAEDIGAFLFSPVHSPGQSRKERIRNALLRWHPDRFRRLLCRIEGAEKGVVEERVGIIARCLNELMAKENRGAHHTL